ncbi:MAG: type II secretion system GspH family protein [Oscillospiraceae bacterium]|nr:type II secretion system GspH family protein [Oscillospiraceae bacterium]
MIGLWKKTGKRIKNRLGMSMVEMLAVVAIIGILAAVAFIGVQYYQRSLGQLERDGIAKQIFIAAQNHLTASKNSGFFNIKSESGKPDPYGTVDTSDIYYVTNSSLSKGGKNEQLKRFLLPDYSVTEPGGNYIIRYQKSTATVLDVFYCSTNGSPDAFNYPLAEGDYSTVMTLRDTGGSNNKNARRNWNGHILGWYGGVETEQLETITLQQPTILVRNEEILSVEVTDNTDSSKISSGDYTLKLIVTGESSEVYATFTLHSPTASSTDGRITKSSDGKSYTVVLDDITKQDKHFHYIKSDDNIAFSSGENLKIQAVAYSTSKLSNVAYSGEATTNSLFADIEKNDSGVYTKAKIGNIRHLENLDPDISNYTVLSGKINITNAEQTSDMSWANFQETIWKRNNPNATGTAAQYQKVGTYKDGYLINKITGEQYFWPINPMSGLSYDGKLHSISDVHVSVPSEVALDAGLFGSTSSITEIKNLELIDFDITAAEGANSTQKHAGALAGSLTGTKIENVLARETRPDATTATTISIGITASNGSAGGLVGNMTAGSVSLSAAALTVNGGSGTAGGLIGTATGTNIFGSYSGGHTDLGEYYEHENDGSRKVDTTTKEFVPIYNVTGATCGGLVGKADGGTITGSYSTCSVSGTSVAGGFVGTATTPQIIQCYCTGLVGGSTRATVFAFLASGSVGDKSRDNQFFEIINEIVEKDSNGKSKGISYMAPSAGTTITVTAFDQSADTYDQFFGNKINQADSKAYDKELVNYYAGKYTLKPIARLVNGLSNSSTSGGENGNNGGESGNTGGTSTGGTAAIPDTAFVKVHYGDWPAPEIFVFNEKASVTPP